MARPATSTSRLLAGSREPVRVATTANVNPAAGGLLTIDGVTLEPGDRVLVKNQADKRQNGIYGVSAGEWYRASDGRSPRAINKGVTVHVAEGTAHEGQTFAFLTPEPVIGTDEIEIGFFLSYDTVGDAETAIEEAAENATAEIGQIADEAIAEVDRESAAAVARVVHEGDVQVVRVEQEGNQQVYLVEAAGEAITGIVSPIIIAENTFGTKGSVELWNPETPPDYVRIAGYWSAGDGGGALYKKVDVEPTHAGKIQSADGTWWELAELHEVTLEMFGGRADGFQSSAAAVGTGTDNYPAFMAALGYGLKYYHPPADGSPPGTNPLDMGSVYASTASIRLLRGKYFVGQTIFIDYNVRISGSGGAGMANAEPQSILLFPPDTTAFHIMSLLAYDPRTGMQNVWKEAWGTILENFRIYGGGGTDMTKHGLLLKTNVRIQGVTVANFAGNGVDLDANVGASTGNANVLHWFGLRSMSNGKHGVHIEGPDVNAGQAVNLDCVSNGGWGIWDSAFLGMTWIGCHVDGNGKKARVSHEDNRYVCVHPTSCPTTEPGSSPAADLIWKPLGAGSVDVFYPQWKIDLTGVYIPGGAYYQDNAGGESVFVGCYSEGGQVHSMMSKACVVIGGLHGTPVLPMYPPSATLGTTPNYITGGGADYHFGVRLSAKASDIPNESRPGAWLTLGEDDFSPVKLNAVGDGATTSMHFPRWNETDGTYDIMHTSFPTSPPMRLTTNRTTVAVNAGRGAGLVAGNVVFPRNIFVGPTAADARLITNSPSTPTAGPAYAQGDIVFNQAPTSGENVGWICTQGGVVATTPLWVSGTNYAVNVYIKTAAGRFYRLMFDPASLSSVFEPTHTPPYTVVNSGTDGYGWTYVAPAVWPPGQYGVVPLTPRPTPWKTGTDYAAGKQISNTAGKFYTCTTDPGAVPSTVEPVHAAGAVTGADGYGWTFTDLAWVTGTIYQLDHLIKAANGIIYRCSTVGGGTSTVQPTHTTAVVGTDVYGWDFMFNSATIPQWVSGTTYKAGDIVRREGEDAHRCIVAGYGACTNEPLQIFAHGSRANADGYTWQYIGNRLKDYLWEFGYPYTQNGSDEYKVMLQNSAGMVYRCSQHRITSLNSTVEPTHTSGEVLETDGHRWAYVTNQSPVWKTFGLVDA